MAGRHFSTDGTAIFLRRRAHEDRLLPAAIGRRRSLLRGTAADRRAVLLGAPLQRPDGRAGQEIQPAGHARAREVRRPRRRFADLRPGAGPHRPRRNRRAHVLLGPDLDRPVSDHALWQRRSARTLSARFMPRRKDHGLWPDRAGCRQQPAGNDDDVSPRGRQVPAQRREVSDFQRRHRRYRGGLRLSGRQDGQRPADERVHRGHGRRHVRSRRR